MQVGITGEYVPDSCVGVDLEARDRFAVRIPQPRVDDVLAARAPRRGPDVARSIQTLECAGPEIVQPQLLVLEAIHDRGQEAAIGARREPEVRAVFDGKILLLAVR